MCARSVGLTLAVAFAMVICTLCQSTAPVSGGGLPSASELLKQHHVELTKASLLSALRHENAEVRYLAAEKLAEDDAQDAIPSITEALSVEKVPASRINIAFALAQLGDDKGFAALKTACHSADLPGYLRARATTYLLDLHRDSCLDAVVSMVESEGDPDSRIQALLLLPSFPNTSKEDSQKVLSLVVKALADPTPAVRMNAGIALGALQDPRAIPYLESAVSNEQDEVVRSTMQAALQRLRAKKED